MSFRPILVTIERPTRTGDGAGGKVLGTPEVVADGVTARRHRYTRTSEDRREMAPAGAAGPGVATVYDCFYAFRAPYPAVAVGDTITEEVSGEVRRVLVVRQNYDWTMQVDCEVVS
jgi:hypothetical protein